MKKRNMENNNKLKFIVAGIALSLCVGAFSACAATSKDYGVKHDPQYSASISESDEKVSVPESSNSSNLGESFGASDSGDSFSESVSPTIEELYLQVKELGYRGSLEEFKSFVGNEEHESGKRKIVSAKLDEEGNLTISYSDGSIIKQEHVWRYAYTYRRATCLREGIEIYTCETCALAKLVTIEQTEHVYEKKIIPATCTEGGYTLHVCRVCEDSYTDEYTSKTEHEYKTEKIAATCTSDGYDMHTCLYCGNSYKDNFIRMSGEHSFKNEKCENCGTDISSVAEKIFDLSKEENVKGYLLGADLYIFGRGATDDYENSPFQDQKITRVYFGEEISRIGAALFKNCKSLSVIANVGNIKSIGRDAFGNTAYSEEEDNRKGDFLCLNDFLLKCESTASEIVFPDDIHLVADGAFSECKYLKTIYYSGVKTEFESLKIGNENLNFSEAEIYFYSEKYPETEGKFWHYEENVPQKWTIASIKVTQEITIPYIEESEYFFTPTVSGRYKITFDQRCSSLYLDEYAHEIGDSEMLTAGKEYKIIIANETDANITGILTIERIE